jgi:hypothetical protein
MANNITTTTEAPFDITKYECSERGLMMPIISEYTWSISARAFFYFQFWRRERKYGIGTKLDLDL